MTGLKLAFSTNEIDTANYLASCDAGEKYRINTDKAFVNISTIGDLSSLHWIESPLKHLSSADHPDHQLCRVHYAALNFRDIMLATGKLPADAIPGMCILSVLDLVVTHLR